MDTPALPPHDATATALPYPYVPPQPALQGAAFGPVFKTLAWGIVLGLGSGLCLVLVSLVFCNASL